MLDVVGGLEELAKLLGGEAGVLREPSHCKLVNGRVARDNQDFGGVSRHDRMFPLTPDLVAKLLKNAHGLAMANTGEPRRVYRRGPAQRRSSAVLFRAQARSPQEQRRPLAAPAARPRPAP